MKNLVFIAAVLLTLCSCSKKWHGCTDDQATNFNINAEKQDGSCVYTTLSFYADSSQYPIAPIDRIEVKIGTMDVGSLTSVYSIGGPIDCSEPATVSFRFEDAGDINWNARTFLTNGTVITRTGSASPDPDQTCVLINAL